MRLASLVALPLLAGCSLFGPPLPPATPSSAAAELEARPARTREAFIQCARDYGRTHGKASDVPIEAIVDSAIYACTAELEAYRAAAFQHAQGQARVLGYVDRSKARTKQNVTEASDEARKAALDSIIRARTEQ